MVVTGRIGLWPSHGVAPVFLCSGENCENGILADFQTEHHRLAHLEYYLYGPFAVLQYY
jgi:hypothetical protein